MSWVINKTAEKRHRQQLFKCICLVWRHKRFCKHLIYKSKTAIIVLSYSVLLYCYCTVLLLWARQTSASGCYKEAHSYPSLQCQLRELNGSGGTCTAHYCVVVHCFRHPCARQVHCSSITMLQGHPIRKPLPLFVYSTKQLSCTILPSLYFI